MDQPIITTEISYINKGDVARRNFLSSANKNYRLLLIVVQLVPWQHSLSSEVL
jgi:hypothetical protein